MPGLCGARKKLPQAVREKQEADDAEYAKLVAKGTPVAQLNTGIDGGMHRVFASKLPNGNTGLSEGGSGLALLTTDKAPGTIPRHVNPPRGPVTSPEQPLTASSDAGIRLDARGCCGAASAERRIGRLLLEPGPQGRPEQCFG